MRPLKLTICGWGPYRDKVCVDFAGFGNQGLFLITGPTGAGKTTIFDAISYALYGALSGEIRDKERSAVRSDFASEEMKTYVELEMEHAGLIYRIYRTPRYLRPKKRGKEAGGFVEEKENAILYRPREQPIEGVKEVNAKLAEILVLDYSQFKQISMIAQGEFARLLTAPPKDKTRIFREIFNTGMYERFTASLGSKAKLLYSGVMEERHKLEETVHVLEAGLEREIWEEVYGERLDRCLAEPFHHAGELLECLKEMEAAAAVKGKQLKGAYQKAQKQAEVLTMELVKRKEENQVIVRFSKVQKERELLKEEKKQISQKEKELKMATDALTVEPLEISAGQVKADLRKAEELQKSLETELETLGREYDGLAVILEKKASLEQLVAKMKQLEAAQTELEQKEKELQQLKQGLDKSQKRYLEKEEAYQKISRQYEEADRQYRLSAIGIVAGMLEEGVACPVCGSKEHPAPARQESFSVSREELQKKREEREQASKELSVFHGEVVAQKTRLELAEQQEKEKKQEIALLSQACNTEDEVMLPFLAMKPEEAEKRLQREWNRIQQLAILIQEKRTRKNQLKEELLQLTAKSREYGQVFEEALTAHGFRSKVEYEQAKRTRQQREHLEKVCREFYAKEAANGELYAHLKSRISATEEMDLTPLETQIAELGKHQKEMLEEQKRWERQESELKRTGQFLQAHRQRADQLAERYGYVKDLENMASGNNPRKLVFEQYVMAGYFDEILRAANLRFAKMTSGRYEMSRVEQVGDGRTKDNLEIQVLDHYTGKYRSVRTLSGGESFKASLSLALGMSDVIQAMSGGIRVDTLFIDEGFGALDSESLDQACETLNSLVEKNRLIGIISHVPELRERIDRQLIVEKSAAGSRIRIS